MLSSRKGKLVINSPTPVTPDKNKNTQNNKSDKPVMTPKTKETVKPILLLSLLIGYMDRRFRLRGIFGGLLWVVSLCIHCAFDFLSARKTYGYAWASIQMLLFIGLVLCTYSIKRKAVPWLEKGLYELEKCDNYYKTFARIRKIFRSMPLFVLLFALLTTGLQFFCYWYDNAFSVSFEQKIPEEAEIALKVVWFLTNVHVLYAFAMFWCIAMCNMYATGYSMIEYHETMETHLKNKQTPITFRQAVHSFAERGQFLKKSASACRVSLAFLLVYSIASLAVNAFYYLYKTRKAGYVYFALMPPICSVYPLCLAAWVTKQYKWYLAVVVKAWAERPESSDEDEESESDHRKSAKEKGGKFGRKFTKRIKSARNRDEKKDHAPRRRSLFPLRQTRSNPMSGGSYSDTESRVEEIPIRDKLKPLGEKLFPPSRNVHFTSVSDTEMVSDEEEKSNPRSRSERIKLDSSPTPARSPNPKVRKAAERLFPQVSQVFGSTSVSDMDGLTDDEEINKTETQRGEPACSPTPARSPNPKVRKAAERLIPQVSQAPQSTSVSDMDGLTDDEEINKKETQSENKPKVDRRRVMELILRGTAKAVGRIKHRANLPKFNFEKYISYLQNVIPTIGFDIMGITVTWNMVSTILFLEVSLLALFVQESIFGSQKAQVSL